MPDLEREALLEESAEDFYEEAPCGYVTTRPDGTVLRVNRTLLRWTGHSGEGLVGQRRFVDLLTTGGRMYHETHYAPLLRMQGEVRGVAFEMLRADGSRLPVLVNSSTKRDGDGAPVLIRTTVFDATDRREYERELLRARDRERAARERAERLQRFTVRLATALDVEAVEEVVSSELGETVRPEDVALGIGASRSVSEDEQTFLNTCSMQASQALERARLYERQRDVALTLQQSLLGGEPPHHSRCSIATYYSPAEESLEVGGDWHDAFLVAENRIGLVVGDVVGRGLGAASAMGQLRSALRALAAAQLEPARVLECLSAFADQTGVGRIATVVYAEIDLDELRMRYVCAGHPPPATIQPGEAPRLLWDGRYPPLGTGPGGSYGEGELTLGRGARLLLFSDGLVERRDRLLDDGLAQLTAEADARRELSPQRLVEELPRAMLDGAPGDDDVCLLCAEISRS